MKVSSLPALGLVMLLAIQGLSQAAPKFRITGVVVNQSNGAPIPHCHLSPSRAGRARGRMAGRQFPGTFAGADTDDQGRFTIMLPSAGAWGLVANASGYTTQSYLEHEGYFSEIVLTDQSPVYNLRFSLPPEASVTGTVVDEAGEAVRNAQVRLFTVPLVLPDSKPNSMNMRSSAMTDDRGYYEFANLPPGNYKVLVSTKPWYSTSAQPRRGNASTADASSSPDPSLDVTYAETWYPGIDDPTQAETLTLHAGDTAQADFHMIPVPAIHLRIITPPTETTPQGRSAPYFPMVERVGSGPGSGGFAGPIVSNATPGQLDVGGLSPGLYQVRLQNQSQESKVALVKVTAGGAQTVDFNQASDAANISIRFDGAGEDENAVQVSLIDAATGQPVTQFNPRFGGGPARGRPDQERPRERVMQVPPGRYEVVLAGRPDLYLTSLSAQSADVDGRFITVHSGDSTLTVHLVRGRASVTGVVTLPNGPDVGAMVLLVPAGLGDPKSITQLVREQSNTDGSFDLAEVIPGQYILLAIDHGWQINWKDPSTLNRYLINGVPLDVRPGAAVKQNIEAQAP